MSQLTQLGGGVFQWVLRSTWQAAVLAGLILAAQWLLRKRLSPAWRHGLWLLLVVRLLMPVSPQSAFSIYNLARSTPKQPAAVSSRSVLSDAAPSELGGNIATEAPEVAKLRGASLVAPVPAVAEPTAKVDWFAVAFWGWLAGVCFFGARLVWTNVRFRSRIGGYQPVADENVNRLFNDCRAIFRIGQPVMLIESEDVDSPAVYGFWRKWLLLPDGIFERFSMEELRCIFLHELAHIKRGDLGVNWVVAGLQVLHWFNPVLWLAWARMRADRELATDALALAYVRESDHAPYGETILKVIEGLTGERGLTGLVGIIETKAQLKERLLAITRFSGARPWRWASVGIAALVAGIGLTGAQEPRQPDATGEPQTAATSRNSTSSANQASQDELQASTKHLIDVPHSIEVTNEMGRTPLCVAALSGRTDDVESLISKGADVNAKGFEAMTPLAEIASPAGLGDDRAFAQVAELLLIHGATVDVVDNSGSTPLLLAAQSGKPRLVEVLLRRGADPAIRRFSPGGRGDTALHLAVQNGQKEIVNLLVKLEAPLDMVDSSGRTPLDLAQQLERKDITDLLRAAAVSAGEKNSKPPSREEMRAFARRMAKGDQGAFDEFIQAATDLYQGIDYEKERGRNLANYYRMRAASKTLGQEAGKGNAVAFAAIKRALTNDPPAGFAPYALGTAAAGGNKEALEMLFHYQQSNIREWDAIEGLIEPVKAGIDPAIAWAAQWLADAADLGRAAGIIPSMTNALEDAAAKGNAKAHEALDKFRSQPSELAKEIGAELGKAVVRGDPGSLEKLSDISKVGHARSSANPGESNANQRAKSDRLSLVQLYAAFNVIDGAVATSNQVAVAAVWRAAQMPYLQELAIRSLGAMAGYGDEAAVEALVNPDKYGFPLSGTVGALKAAADSGNQKAIDALAAVARDSHETALWSMIANDLTKVAAAGNSVAIDSLISMFSSRTRAGRFAVPALQTAAKSGNQKAIDALAPSAKQKPAPSYADFPPELQRALDEAKQKIGANGEFYIAGRITFSDGAWIESPQNIQVNFEEEFGGSDTCRVSPGGWFLSYGNFVRSGDLAVRAFSYLPIDLWTNFPANNINYLAFEMERVPDNQLTTIQGTITDQTGAPLAGVSIGLAFHFGASPGDNAKPVRNERTGSDGRFAFSGLAPAAYQLYANHPGRAYAAAPVTTRSGATIQTSLTLFPRKSVTFDYVCQNARVPDFTGGNLTRGTMTLDQSKPEIRFTSKNNNEHDLSVYQRGEQVGFVCGYGSGQGNGFYDAGAVAFDAVTNAPATGYSMRQQPCVVGHVYVVKTYDGHYVKLVVKEE